ncbi:Nif3-like dinuclear metal center hexameric protein [Litchfieldia alkalitelluris]|uniref:Nif3-like dinuclear metal center hexameric protein n=1 Tax=Litchfieldia alkalitelluris TaxID=304268 RepID=UPI000997A39B|nr:Nif3-like dinuclear metal center hexameric protein [Litchfieldia alkalitelluris]
MGITVQDVINHLTSPVGEIENTVDTLKFGTPTMDVTGIAITFMPTYDAIKKAVELGANMLITHEGLFYSHWDKTELEDDQVYLEKYNLIKESGIAVFRNHDYIHRYQPDGIMQGLLQSLQWDSYEEQNEPVVSIVEIPTMTLKEVAEYLKNKLDINYVRSMGNPTKNCARIGLLAGYRGGGLTAIPLFEKYNLDLIIYGEGPEWETPEYVRDSISQGRDISLIVLGHAESEQPGMVYLSKQLEKEFPTIPIRFISNKPCFDIL